MFSGIVSFIIYFIKCKNQLNHNQVDNKKIVIVTSLLTAQLSADKCQNNDINQFEILFEKCHYL